MPTLYIFNKPDPINIFCAAWPFRSAGVIFQWKKAITHAVKHFKSFRGCWSLYLMPYKKVVHDLEIIFEIYMY